MSAQKSPDVSTSSKPCSGGFSCSVCLEAVTSASERSIAKLKCGHRFHLDCIGSAFNAKGRMQCPNCRQVEHGQWLYANNCFLHEDFVDDLTYEDDAEFYGVTRNLQLGHIPWCPHQGLYAHFPLNLEELDNSGNGYLDPMLNMRQGSRASFAGHICPYLSAETLSAGGLPQHTEDFIAVQIGHHPSRNTRRAANFSSAHRSRLPRQAVPIASAGVPLSYERTSQTYNPSARFLQPRANRHHTTGLFFDNPQSVHTGTSQGPSQGGNSGQFLIQPLHINSVQGVRGNAHFYLPNAYQNGYLSSTQPRQGPVVSVPSLRTLQLSSMNEPVREYGPWGVPSTLGQSPSQLLDGDGMLWTTHNQVDSSWMRGSYVPQAQFGTSQWWALVPSRNNVSQRASPNMGPNVYQEGQFFGAGLFAMPTASSQGSTEHISEGPYGWVPPGFC